MMTQGFPQAKPAQHLATLGEAIAQYRGRVGIIYGIYRLKWTEKGLIENPKFKPVLRALKETPPERAERAIAAFLNWASSATNVRDIYKALEVAIIRGWEQ